MPQGRAANGGAAAAPTESTARGRRLDRPWVPRHCAAAAKAPGITATGGPEGEFGHPSSHPEPGGHPRAANRPRDAPHVQAFAAQAEHPRHPAGTARTRGHHHDRKGKSDDAVPLPAAGPGGLRLPRPGPVPLAGLRRLPQEGNAGTRARANASQDHPTPASEFARDLLAAVQKRRRPHLLRLGNGSRALPLLAALVPKAWLQAGLKKRFGLNRSL